jgi:large subunit ribosomal protein L18
MIKHFNSNKARLKRHMRARNRVIGTQQRPRLNVFRSGKQIYAQIIDDRTGRTLAAASSLDEVLKDFKPTPPVASATTTEEHMEEVEVVTEAAPVKKAPKAPVKAPAKTQSQKSGGRIAQAKTVLPAAKKGEKKTPVEALVAIASNHKVALAREVGKLVAQRAKEQGVEQVVFDRGGYIYHGRVAALAEGAREIGLKF